MKAQFAIAVWLSLASSLVAAEPAATNPPPAGVTPDKLPPNAWVAFNPVYAGAEGRHVAVGWNKMVYDAAGKRALLMDRWKDKPRDSTIYANAVIAIDPVAGRAEVLKLNSYKRQEKPGGGYSTVAIDELLAKDPTPVDRHPYGCLAWSAHDNALYLGPGANRTWKRHPGDFWCFDLTNLAWRALDPAVAGNPLEGAGNPLESVMCCDDAARALVFYNARDKSTWIYDIVGNKWRKSAGKAAPQAGMAAAMTYDSKRELVYLFGGPGSGGKDWNTPGPELWAFSVAKDEWTRLADAPVPARAPALAYDGRHDVVLASISSKDKPNTNLIYDPATDRWRELAAAGPKGSWMCLCYDTARDLFIHMAGNYGDVRWWVMRYAP